MFRLTASLGTLQVGFNYEGAGCHTLSQVMGILLSWCLHGHPSGASFAVEVGRCSAGCSRAGMLKAWLVKGACPALKFKRAHSRAAAGTSLPVCFCLPYLLKPGFTALASFPHPNPPPPTAPQASVDRFSFELDIRPDTRMRIKSTLGNVQAGQGRGCARSGTNLSGLAAQGLACSWSEGR